MSQSSSSLAKNIFRIKGAAFLRGLLIITILTGIFTSLYYFPLKAQLENHRRLSQTIVIDDISPQITELQSNTFQFSLITFFVLLISLPLLTRTRSSPPPNKQQRIHLRKIKPTIIIWRLLNQSYSKKTH